MLQSTKTTSLSKQSLAMAYNHVDTHPGIVKVDFQKGDFASQLLAAKVYYVASCRLKF